MTDVQYGEGKSVQWHLSSVAHSPDLRLQYVPHVLYIQCVQELLTVLADVDAVVAVVQHGQALLLAFNALGLFGNAGAVVAGKVGVRAALNPLPAEIGAPEDVVAVTIARAAGRGLVVALRTSRKRRTRHRRGQGSRDEAHKSEGDIEELHIASCCKSVFGNQDDASGRFDSG
jgi:hypothetical protein